MRERLELGWVAGAHGLRGAVKVRLLNAESEALRAGVSLWLHERGNPLNGEAFAIDHVNRTPREALVSLVGVTDRDQAERLKGRSVAIDRAQLGPIADDEYYLADLVGRETQARSGESLGIVVEVTSNTAQDLIEVEWTDERGASLRWLMPLLSDFVVEIGSVLIVDPAPGMLPEALESRLSEVVQTPRSVTQGPSGEV